MSELVEEIRARRDAQEEEAARRDYKRAAKSKERQERPALEEQQQADDEFTARHRSGRITTGTPKVPASVAGDGAGLLLGFLAYVLVLNYFRGGVPAVRGWFAAKFLNKPYKGGAYNLAPAAPSSPDGTPSPSIRLIGPR